MNVRIDTSDGPPVVIATMTSHEARQLAKDVWSEADVLPEPGRLLGGKQASIGQALLAAANLIDEAAS